MIGKDLKELDTRLGIHACPVHDAGVTGSSEEGRTNGPRVCGNLKISFSSYVQPKDWLCIIDMITWNSEDFNQHLKVDNCCVDDVVLLLLLLLLLLLISIFCPCSSPL